MADLSFLKQTQKPVAVLGLGVSGQAVADALLESGVAFHAWDDKNRDAKYPISDFTGNLQDYAFLVPAAGIKPTHPVLQEAAAKNIPIRSDVDLLLQSAPEATVIAITGTNGKSTTTALIGHVLEQAGKNVAVGGNLGQAACSLPTLGGDGIYVLEMSSYMLEISAYPVADIAVFLNITPDHLDWHGTFENYKASKEKIFQQREGRPPQKKIYGLSMPQYAGQDIVMIKDHTFLKGEHNVENMAVAFAACRAVGLDAETIIRHIMTFEGLPHRQKRVATYGDVEFINDSKGTNPDATAKALASYNDIYWILGGQPTADMLNGLDVFYPKIRHAYLIGEASNDFAQILDGQVSFTKCGVMENAIKQAFSDALVQKGHATILLSPACKSWDQYKDYQQRGDEFTSLAKLLIEERNLS